MKKMMLALTAVLLLILAAACSGGGQDWNGTFYQYLDDHHVLAFTFERDGASEDIQVSKVEITTGNGVSISSVYMSAGLINKNTAEDNGGYRFTLKGDTLSVKWEYAGQVGGDFGTNFSGAYTRGASVEETFDLDAADQDGCGSDTTIGRNSSTKSPANMERGDLSGNAEFAFADLNGWEFWFGSGAGAWRTLLKISVDGTFYGNYMDSDMGDTGEGYPRGITYVCEFSGKFTSVKKVGDYEYSLQCENLKQTGKEGEEEIQEAFGLDDDN